MRIITQDKKHDIPYERVCISIAENKLVAYDTNNLGDNDCWILGFYESEERASEIMKEIRGKYCLIKESEFLGMEEASCEIPFYYMPEE